MAATRSLRSERTFLALIEVGAGGGVVTEGAIVVTQDIVRIVGAVEGELLSISGITSNCQDRGRGRGF
jgi:hypothetical protein